MPHCAARCQKKFDLLPISVGTGYYQVPLLKGVWDYGGLGHPDASGMGNLGLTPECCLTLASVLNPARPHSIK